MTRVPTKSMTDVPEQPRGIEMPDVVASGVVIAPVAATMDAIVGVAEAWLSSRATLAVEVPVVA